MWTSVGSRRIAKNRSLGAYLSSTEQMAKAAYIQNSSADLIASGSIVGDSLTPELNIGDKAIVSADFVSGLSGWRIAGTGEAEFQSVDVRGHITADSGQIGNWNISGAAASRVFGTSTLFGTYLESSVDIGDNDLDITTGTYVGLFKSFVPDSVNIVTAGRTSNIVTLTTAEEHFYAAGDQIIVTMVSGAYDATMNNGGLPVTITSTTSTTITYSNTGSTVASGAAVGSVIQYVEDVAGLYLKDYGKREFDYGYFSNKGIAYRSADILNLVHNSSFEWSYDLYDEFGYVMTETNIPSTADWDLSGGTGGTLATQDFNSLPYYGTQSAAGALVSWTTSAPTNYLRGKISYSAADQYHLLSENRLLYFGFEEFFKYDPVQKIVNANPTATTTRITFGTTSAHGLTTNDLVYIDLSVYNTNVDTTMGQTNYPIIERGYLGGYEFASVFKVMSTPSSTTFTITNTTGASFSGTTTRVARTNDLGIARTQAIYKVHFPAVPLSEFQLKFSNGASVQLDDLFSAETLSNYSGDKIYVYSTPDEYMDRYLNANSTVAPMGGYFITNPMTIQGNALRDAYQSLDPTGYAAGNAIDLLMPAYVYKQTLDTYDVGTLAYGFTSTTKLTDSAGVGFIMDSVYLSTINKSFYKGLYDPATSTTYTFDGSTTGLESDGVTYGLPLFPSIKDGLTWIDVDLDTQLFTLQNVDELSMAVTLMSKDMIFGPSIIPYNAAQYDSGLLGFTAAWIAGYPETIDIDGNSNQGLGTTSQPSTFSGGRYSFYDASTNSDKVIQSATLYHVGDEGSSGRLRAYRDSYSTGGSLITSVEATTKTEVWSMRYGYKTVSSMQASVIDTTGTIYGSTEPEFKNAYIEVVTSGASLSTLSSLIQMSADTISINDSGTLTTGITAASNWTLGAYTYRRNGNVVQASITVTRTTSNITVPAGGNFTDSTIATMPTGFRPSFNGGVLSTAGSNGSIMTGFVNTGGGVTITATSDAATINIGQVLNVSVMYMV
jgi:hypothetical protein